MALDFLELDLQISCCVHTGVEPQFSGRQQVLLTKPPFKKAPGIQPEHQVLSMEICFHPPEPRLCFCSSGWSHHHKTRSVDLETECTQSLASERAQCGGPLPTRALLMP